MLCHGFGYADWVVIRRSRLSGTALSGHLNHENGSQTSRQDDACGPRARAEWSTT
jgi:hypothetical protein